MTRGWTHALLRLSLTVVIVSAARIPAQSEVSAAAPAQSAAPAPVAPRSSAPTAERALPAGPAADIPTNAPIQSLGGGRYRIGDVQLDATRQTVRFPAAVNLKETLSEYVLVTDYGKIHESVLRTETQPYQIHLAMLLLGVQVAATNTLPDNPDTPPPGRRLRIDITWTNTEPVTRSAESLVYSRRASAPLGPTEWVYTGSSLFEGTFLAQQEGSIISLIDDPAALILYPGPDRADDENWIPHAPALPEVETMVEVTLRLAPDSKPKAATHPEPIH